MSRDSVSFSAPPDRGMSARDAAAVAAVFRTDLAAGLSDAEAARRLAETGPNRLPATASRPPWRVLVAQFSNLMVIVLLAAAAVSGLVGEGQDAVAIGAIVLLNAILGFVQEFRAERAVAALAALAAPRARVVRSGAERTIPAAELVPGDLLRLEAGNVVPADLRWVEAAGLRVEESSLTGESQPVDKSVEPLPPGERALGDRRNEGFQGTLVVAGRGLGLTVATGAATELGRIAASLGKSPTRTPLERRLAVLAGRLALAVFALCAVIFAVGLARGEEPTLMFLTALSLAVAAIPEALPAVVTVSLAVGARRMAARNALIRRLPAVETLGSVTCICSDKTGTLTENRMRVCAIRTADAPPEAASLFPDVERAPRPLLLALALSNDATRGADGALDGDPTEIALSAAAADAGYQRAPLERAMPRRGELPFSAERGMMTTLHDGPRGGIAFVKGAPEKVIPRSTRAWSEAGPVPLDRRAVLAAAERLAHDGLRVLAFATRDVALPTAVSGPLSGLQATEIEDELLFLGLVGLLDPPRSEAAEALAECRAAGIDVKMVTGDHPETARAIARQLDFSGASLDSSVLTGPALARLAGPALAEAAASARIFARVAPDQKIAIVQALQARGEVVAMTGDGVNDAPALRRADIGVAMARGGTDVAREAADMVLLDSNFTSIVAAIEEGRRIYDNVRKFVRYSLSSNSGEIWVLFLAPFLGLPVPLLPIHILWINLVTDGLPGLALAVEPAERQAMRRPPRPPGESILARGLWQHAVWVGLLMGGVSLFAEGWAYHRGLDHWRSLTFTVLTLSQLGHLLAIRSERDSTFRLGLRSNLPLLGAVALTVLLQMAALYLPFLQAVLKTEPLSLGELGLCAALSSVVFFAVEIEKLLVRRGLVGRSA